MAPGYWVRINGPFGGFSPAKNKQTLLIGTGIGTVPILSIIQESRAKDEPIRAILSVNQRSELALDSSILLGPGKPACTILEYQVDKKLIDQYFLKQELASLGSGPYEILICSSPKLRKIMIGELVKLGIQKHQIRHETFGY